MQQRLNIECNANFSPLSGGIKMKRIIYVVIDGKKYYRDQYNEIDSEKIQEYYRFLYFNTNKITKIIGHYKDKLNLFIIRTKNGKMHSLDNYAFDDRFLKIRAINGIIMDDSEYNMYMRYYKISKIRNKISMKLTQ
jgi:hypothetical protein